METSYSFGLNTALWLTGLA